jgi:hypothetical protein
MEAAGRALTIDEAEVYDAIEICDVVRLREFVAQGLDVNAAIRLRGCASSYPLLHIAAARSLCGDAAFMALLEMGARLDVRDGLGNTTLHAAVEGYVGSSLHRLSRVEYLLRAGADVNAVNRDQETPLIVVFELLNAALTVSHRKCRTLIKVLLSFGAKLPRSMVCIREGKDVAFLDALFQPIVKAGSWKEWVSKHRRILSSFVSKCAPLPVDVAGHVVDFAWPAGGF